MKKSTGGSAAVVVFDYSALNAVGPMSREQGERFISDAEARGSHSFVIVNLDRYVPVYHVVSHTSSKDRASKTTALTLSSPTEDRYDHYHGKSRMCWIEFVTMSYAKAQEFAKLPLNRRCKYVSNQGAVPVESNTKRV